MLIPYEEFEEHQAWQIRQQERRSWLAELQAIADKVSAALSDDDAEALIDEAVRETATHGKSTRP